MTEKNNESKNMAIAGVCGAVIYGIADMFLYMGTDIFFICMAVTRLSSVYLCLSDYVQENGDLQAR
ncbi:MAG: hypothetical protein IJV15_06615 [Lachnospiraceae bacterium]|nr:hypothetical protein [Lachnospiraceae bacterium]